MLLRPGFLKEIRERVICVSGEEVEALLDGYIELRDLIGYLLDVRDGERPEDPELNKKCSEAINGPGVSL